MNLPNDAAEFLGGFSLLVLLNWTVILSSYDYIREQISF